jgi:hypothetical protein
MTPQQTQKFRGVPRNTTAPDYRLAATIFWPRHADLIYDARDEINARIYNGELPNVPVLVGLTKHARSLGNCSMRTPPVITLHPSLTQPRSENPWGVPARHWNAAYLVDVLTHEMIHAWHAVNPPGAYPDWCPPHSDDQDVHNNPHWCAEIMRQSPLVGVGEIIASPWRRARQRKKDGGDGGLEYQPVLPGSITRYDASRWPHLTRPPGYYDDPTPWYARTFPATPRNTTGDHANKMETTP